MITVNRYLITANGGGAHDNYRRRERKMTATTGGDVIRRQRDNHWCTKLPPALTSSNAGAGMALNCNRDRR